jgi:hypothetical protein
MFYYEGDSSDSRGGKCPRDWVELYKGVYDKCPLPTCNLFSTCATCTAISGCGWCPNSKVSGCTALREGFDVCGQRVTPVTNLTFCPVLPCSALATCDACMCYTHAGGYGACKWCETTSKCGESAAVMSSCPKYTQTYCPANVSCRAASSCEVCRATVGCDWCNAEMYDPSALETTYTNCLPADGFRCDWYSRLCPRCSQLKTCDDCVSESSCGWCRTTSKCIYGGSWGAYGDACPPPRPGTELDRLYRDDYWHYWAPCDRCSQVRYTVSCENCVSALPPLQCGWNSDRFPGDKCVSGGPEGPDNITAAGWKYTLLECDPCRLQLNCTACLRARCQWCNQTSTCMKSATFDTCPFGQLYDSYLSCPKPKGTSRFTLRISGHWDVALSAPNGHRLIGEALQRDLTRILGVAVSILRLALGSLIVEFEVGAAADDPALLKGLRELSVAYASERNPFFRYGPMNETSFTYQRLGGNDTFIAVQDLAHSAMVVPHLTLSYSLMLSFLLWLVAAGL